MQRTSPALGQIVRSPHSLCISSFSSPYIMLFFTPVGHSHLPSQPATASTTKHLSLVREQNLDHSIIGKAGSEIFHEMMLRHCIKDILAVSFYPSITPSRALPTLNSSSLYVDVAEGHDRVSAKPPRHSRRARCFQEPDPFCFASLGGVGNDRSQESYVFATREVLRHVSRFRGHRLS